jgi:preprotein translocase subunit SecG
MTILFVILVILIAIVLGMFVLIQNPKGGGLSGTFGGLGNQLMGVKQTTDILEKGTWFASGALAILCLTSSVFIGKAGSKSSTNDNLLKNAPVTAPQNAPVAPPANAPAPVNDSPKK